MQNLHSITNKIDTLLQYIINHQPDIGLLTEIKVKIPIIQLIILNLFLTKITTIFIILIQLINYHQQMQGDSRHPILLIYHFLQQKNYPAH